MNKIIAMIVAVLSVTFVTFAHAGEYGGNYNPGYGYNNGYNQFNQGYGYSNGGFGSYTVPGFSQQEVSARFYQSQRSDGYDNYHDHPDGCFVTKRYYDTDCYGREIIVTRRVWTSCTCNYHRSHQRRWY